MSYPKKKRGFRTITLEDKTYRWHFAPRRNDSLLALQGAMSSGQQLSVILLGWRDPWINFSDIHLATENSRLQNQGQNQPPIITPKFVRDAVMHGLANGWNPSQRGTHFYCVYQNGIFSMLSPNLEALLTVQ